MPSEIFLIRHGQSTFNAIFDVTAVDPMHFDAPLSPLGWQQVESAKCKVGTLPAPDMIVCSPLTRAIETTLGLFEKSDAPIFVSGLHKERLGNSCDVGRPPAALASDFPMLSFKSLRNPWWHDGPPDARGIPVEPEAIFAQRVEEFRVWLATQTSGVIMVIGHGTFFHRLTGRHFANCEIARWGPVRHDMEEPAGVVASSPDVRR